MSAGLVLTLHALAAPGLIVAAGMGWFPSLVSGVSRDLMKLGVKTTKVTTSRGADAVW